MSEADWKSVGATVEQGAARSGLDIVHAFSVGTYNARVPSEWQLHDSTGSSLGLLIGNTRALWPVFLEALKADPVLASHAHPLNEYVERRVRAELAASGVPHWLYFAHETEPRALPIQRMAELAGLASLSPSHLSVHPLYGPWFALRAVAVLELPGPTAAPPKLESPCAGCKQPCVPALHHALSVTGPALGGESIALHAAAWVAVRDACPVGRDARYGEAQLAYHYTKRRTLLGQ